MSALRKAASQQPRTFTTYTEVEVDIDGKDLEREGWVYVGKQGEPPTEHVLDVVRRWHDDAHEGPWMWCAEEPCDTLRGRGEV